MKPLIQKINDNGGICKNNMPLLFELRFAADLEQLGLSENLNYEFSADVDDTTIDFKIEKDNMAWLVELVSVGESNPAKNATKTENITDEIQISRRILSSDAEDKKQSEEKEMILVQQKIGEKVFQNNKNIKFTQPSENVYSIILVDMNGYLGGIGKGRNLSDFVDDFREIAYGRSGFKKSRWHLLHRWNNKLIKGIFEEENPIKSIKHVQERIYFIGFAHENHYGKGKLLKQIYYLCNPILFNYDECYKSTYEKMPFKAF